MTSEFFEISCCFFMCKIFQFALRIFHKFFYKIFRVTFVIFSRKLLGIIFRLGISHVALAVLFPRSGSFFARNFYKLKKCKFQIQNFFDISCTFAFFFERNHIR